MGPTKLSSEGGQAQHQRSTSAHLSNIGTCHEFERVNGLCVCSMPFGKRPSSVHMCRQSSVSKDADYLPDCCGTSTSEFRQLHASSIKTLVTPELPSSHDTPSSDFSMSDEIEEVDESGPVVKPERFSFQSSSKDSGVVMDFEDPSPRSYFDDTSDEEMGEHNTRYVHLSIIST